MPLKNTERAMLNAKVLKLKLRLAELGIDPKEMPVRVGMTRNRWNWFLNDEAEDDRLITMKMPEIMLMAIAFGIDAREIAEEFGLGDPTWLEADKGPLAPKATYPNEPMLMKCA